MGSWEKRIPVNVTTQQWRDIYEDKRTEVSTLCISNLEKKKRERKKLESEMRGDIDIGLLESPRNVNYAEPYQKIEEEKLTRQSRISDCKSTTYKSSCLEELESEVGHVGESRRPDNSSCPPSVLQLSLEELDALYNAYSVKLEPDPNFTISTHQDEITKTIEQNPVVMIQGETGCGKSTQVPQFILFDHMKYLKHCNIIVTQPRKIAAISVAKRVCAENGWEIGGLCGYQVGLDNVSSDHTCLLFCTTGVLLQKLITAKTIDNYTHVVLDEVHERSQEMDFTMVTVRKLLREKCPNVKVILMSATMDVSVYRDYFGYVDQRNHMIQQPRVINVIGRTYTVEQMYLDDLKSMGKLPDMMDINEPELHEDAMKLAVNIILSFYNKHINDARGSVLVFLPGFDDIESMKAMLEPYVDEYGLVLHRLHSMIPSHEQMKVFGKCPKDKMKVILSTNIAESSITVSDVKYVIDFCLTKSLSTDTSTNYTSLKLEWASKGNCNQRMGRAGRVTNGTVYRLVWFKFFEQLPNFEIPEILRSPLKQLILKAKLLDMGKPIALLATCITPPQLSNIENTVLALKEEGSLDARCLDPHDGLITGLGRIVGMLPVDTHLGKFMLMGHSVGLLMETVHIAALHSLPSIFVQSKYQFLQMYISKMIWSDDTMSDSLASYYAYKAWDQMSASNKFRTSNEELNWCTHNKLDMRRLKEVRTLIQELFSRLSTYNIKPHPVSKPADFKQPGNQLLLKLIMCGAFYPNYFQPARIDEKEAYKEINNYNPNTTVYLRGFPDGTGLFYKKDLQRLLSNCDPNNKPFNINIEGSKALVEFSKDSSREIPLALYAAIKMRNSRSDLLVNAQVNSVSLQDEAIIEEGMMTMMSGRGGGGGSGCESATNTTAQPNYRPPRPQLPSLNMPRISIVINHIIECGHFWATYSSQEYMSSVVTLHSSIQNWVMLNKNLKLKNFKENVYCLAPFTEPGGSKEYYRAEIMKVNKKHEAKVFFLDFGNQSVVSLNDLYPLDSAFCLTPSFAFEVKLCNIKPSPIRSYSNNWSQQNNAFFQQIVRLNTQYFADVYSVVDSVVRVRLFDLKEAQHNNNINNNNNSCYNEVDFNELLINSGHAIFAEEPHISKINNLERSDVISMFTRPTRRMKDTSIFFNDDDPGNLKDEDDDGSGGNVAGAFGSSGGVLDFRFSQKRREIENARRVLKNKDLLQKVRLRGPYSPFEVSFYFMPSFSSVRLTTVEQSSVNSIFLSTEPETSTISPLMIAAFVSLNPTNEKLIARETAIMPAIRGLDSIVPVLFAPLLEYRISKDGARITGALCGLGYHSNTIKVSLHPENDVEVVFDVQFDLKDAKLINEIRSSFNLILDESMDWSNKNLLKIQKEITTKLFELFYKNRDVCVPVPVKKQGQWGKLKKPMRITGYNFNEDDPKATTYSIYLPHHDVLLTNPAPQSDSSQGNHQRGPVRNSNFRSN